MGVWDSQVLSLGTFGSKDQRLTGSLHVMGSYGKDTWEDSGRLGLIIQVGFAEPGRGSSLRIPGSSGGFRTGVHVFTLVSHVQHGLLIPLSLPLFASAASQFSAYSPHSAS